MNNPHFLFEGKIALTGIVTPDFVGPNGRMCVLENGLLDEDYPGSDFHHRKVIPIRLRDITNRGIERIIEVSLTDEDHTEKEGPPPYSVKDFFEIGYSGSGRQCLEGVLMRMSPSGKKLVTYIDSLKRIAITDVKTGETTLEHTLITPHGIYASIAPSSNEHFLFSNSQLYFLADMRRFHFDEHQKPFLGRSIAIYRVDLEKSSLSRGVLFESVDKPFKHGVLSDGYSPPSVPFIITRDGRYMLATYIDKKSNGHQRLSVHFVNLESLAFEEDKTINLPKPHTSSTIISLSAVLNDDNGDLYLLAVYDNLEIQISDSTTYDNLSSTYVIHRLDGHSNRLINHDKFEGHYPHRSSVCFYSNGYVVALFGYNINPFSQNNPFPHSLSDPLKGFGMVYNPTTRQARFSGLPEAIYRAELRRIGVEAILGQMPFGTNRPLLGSQ